MQPEYDFFCRDHGALATIIANSCAADDWLADNVDAPSECESIAFAELADCGRDQEGRLAWTLRSITGEPRFMLDIALAMIDEGLVCPNSGQIQ